MLTYLEPVAMVLAVAFALSVSLIPVFCKAALGEYSAMIPHRRRSPARPVAAAPPVAAPVAAGLRTAAH